MTTNGIAIRHYVPGDQQWFESLNRAWIEEYFEMEPVDKLVLQNPQEYILDKGGKILMAEIDDEVAGTVALKFVSDGVYEFTKMAVAEKFRGRKIGHALAEAALLEAKQLGAGKVILYSNTRLRPAISLYRKIGFREVPVDAVYKRSDIKMEIRI
jgi:N-acetylglutamate synthase-like GNAT family acetyltransferase